MSPVGAHGGSCAIESVAALANSLTHHLRLCFDNDDDGKTIQSVFETYQKTRETRVRKIAGTVHFMTRMVTWDNYMMRFVARYVLPWLNDVTLVSGLVKEAVRVDFLPLPSRSKGFHDQTSEGEKRDAEKFQAHAKVESGTVYYCGNDSMRNVATLVLNGGERLPRTVTSGFAFPTTRGIW